MVKNRLIPCIVTRAGLVVQSFGFNKYLPIGRLDSAIEFFVNWDVDEILILDITASRENRTFNSDLIREAVKNCFVPLTIGGGIGSLKEIEVALDCGADKVSVNTAIFEKPNLISEGAKKYGSQCITASVDAKFVNGDHIVFKNGGRVSTEMNVQDFCQKLESEGAGEIFLTSIDRDGSRLGYDVELISKVSDAIRIPVVACGGVGRFSHLREGIEAGADAVSAANIFQHTEHNTIAAKSMMKRDGLNVRLCSEAKYDKIDFDFLDRPI